MKIVLDTNCFIDAMNTKPTSRDPIAKILNEYKKATIGLHVSRHTLAELERKPDDALNLAKTLPVVPLFPIGTWAGPVGSWEHMEGTWCDAEANDSIQEELSKLANSGNDIRDRGAFLDALKAKADVFVTADRQLVADGPAERIFERFRLRILSPKQLVKILQQSS
jgi:predicted nucleic acid-binding protein